jgi:hypothetical protein
VIQYPIPIHCTYPVLRFQRNELATNLRGRNRPGVEKAVEQARKKPSIEMVTYGAEQPIAKLAVLKRNRYY